ncbi:MAG TPA: YkgJ family cysteine cluster protein [Chitinophagales bacterium]|nr:YkgJ family cysteine cluster protein [Chitinophagales bacterium]HNL08513.1 YkgJ family cysteine cluster protein [Chitinophagales bacterium]
MLVKNNKHPPITMPIPSDWQRKAREAETANKSFFKQIKQRTPKNLDEQVKQLHDEVFETLDCLTCANCCKTTSPLFLQKDIERLAKFLSLKAGDFTAQYLRIDEDGDFVLQQTPCPFLGHDNMCMVYEARPNACREYPHTNQRKFHALLRITQKNALICPAVYQIVERLKTIY